MSGKDYEKHLDNLEAMGFDVAKEKKQIADNKNRLKEIFNQDETPSLGDLDTWAILQD